MRKSRRLLFSMSISMFMCIVISFILVSNSCIEIRQYVTILLPFLKQKKEVLLNIILGIFASSFIAYWGFVFEAIEEKRKMRLFIKKTYQQVYFNLIPYIDSLDYDQVRAIVVMKSDLIDDVREIIINYKYRYRIYQFFKKQLLKISSNDVDLFFADFKFLKYVKAIEVIGTLHDYFLNLNQLYFAIKTHTFTYVEDCKLLKMNNDWYNYLKVQQNPGSDMLNLSEKQFRDIKTAIRNEEIIIKQLYRSLFFIKERMIKEIRSLENTSLNIQMEIMDANFKSYIDKFL